MSREEGLFAAPGCDGGTEAQLEEARRGVGPCAVLREQHGKRNGASPGTMLCNFARFMKPFLPSAITSPMECARRACTPRNRRGGWDEPSIMSGQGH